MARSQRHEEKVRLSLKLAPSTKARLDRLVELADVDTMTEAIRRALALYEMALENEREGGQTVLKTQEGAEQRVLLDV